MHLKLLLERGLLGPGDLLYGRDISYSICVREDGLLELNRWPLPLRTLKEATWRAEAIFQYGLGVEPAKLQVPNPLHYWHYEDQFSNRIETLNRLWQLYKSSYSVEATCCELCAQAIASGVQTEPQADAGKFFLVGVHGDAIAPRRHFTDHDQLPARDARVLDALILREVASGLRSGLQIAVARKRSAAGHIYYEIQRFEPQTNNRTESQCDPPPQ